MVTITKKPPKLYRNLKFGQIIILYMNLRLSIFRGATSRGLEHNAPQTCDSEVY